jgi:hypothetical protein
MSVQSTLDSLAGRRDVQLLGLALVAELLLLAVYVAATPAELTRPRYALYPFVWINVGLWAVLRTVPPRATPGRRLVAGLVAGLYLLVLCWLAGLVGFVAGAPADLLGVSIGYGSPGWERIRIVTAAVYVVIVPYRVIGYLVLAYLVYITILDTAAAALSGALGFISCLSCSFPILASLAAGVFGGGAAVTGALYAYSVDISTVVFVLAVALLYYRPGFGRSAGQRME